VATGCGRPGRLGLTIVAAGLALLLVPSAVLAAGLSGAVQLRFGSAFGQSLYGLEHTVEAEPSSVFVRSELDWPVDVLLLGLEATLGGDLPAGRRWGLSLVVQTNLTDPRGEMADSDWWSIEGVLPLTKFSFTTSATEARGVLGELRGWLAPVGWGTAVNGADLLVLLGYRHEWLDLSAFGADGWQLDDDVRVAVDLAADTRAADYRLHRLLPFLGVGLQAWLLEVLLLDVELRLLGVFGLDRDDHVLRNKLARGTAYGLGTSLSLAPRWSIALTAALRLALGVVFEVQYLNGFAGTLEQDYYADDPYLPGDETALDLPDVDFYLESLRFTLQAVVELRF